MADSKRAALQATAAAPFTTLERVRPHTKPIGLLAAVRFPPAPAER